jgi:hypothetical protein
VGGRRVIMVAKAKTGTMQQQGRDKPVLTKNSEHIISTVGMKNCRIDKAFP